MEQKDVFLSMGIGIGLSLGLATLFVGRNIESIEISDYEIVSELTNLVIDGKNSKVTFEEFPFYLREKIKILLTSAGYVHLTQHHLSKHAMNLSPVSRAILLSGPTDFYNRKLARALAHYFESKLLFLDIDSFAFKIKNYYGCNVKKTYMKRIISDVTSSDFYGSLSSLFSTGITRGILKGQSSSTQNSINPSKLHENQAYMKCTSRYGFNGKRLIDSLYQVLVSLSETGSVILYIKDCDKILLESPTMYSFFQQLLNKLSGSVLVLGSRIYGLEDTGIKVDEKLTTLFPCHIEITPPQDEARLKTWKIQLDEGVKKRLLKDTRNYIAQVLEAHDIACDDLNSIDYNDAMLLINHIKETAASAIFYQLMDNKHPEYRNGKLIISAESLCHVSSVFKEAESSKKNNKKTTEESKKKGPPDNAFEKCIRQELVHANELGVSFSDIGALDDVKKSLQEAVMLPLRRPDLFKSDGILKPCKGVLLFGPPGTGKTMLAKAIASEAGASFINVSASSITSMWFGDAEKNVRALFSLAAKVAPTIIFIDEVDSMLGQRKTEYGHDTMRRIKNEFMTHWDGLLSKSDEKIIVLGATNMPFDLDEAIIRRFQRRIMVGLPSAENRETILKTLLAKERYEDIDFKELSTMTEGYSGSDLKNLCMTAAYRPALELVQQEKTNSSDAMDGDKYDQAIPLRPLNMEDMRQAKIKVSASFAEEGSIMNKLKEWNEMFGEGGSRKKEEKFLTYFL